jgi:hypothetical protein
LQSSGNAAWCGFAVELGETTASVRATDSSHISLAVFAKAPLACLYNPRSVEDVVGIKVRDKKRGWMGLMTWGRLWDPVDATELLRVVKRHFTTCGIDEADEVEVCWSLRDLSSAEYFYEAILHFSWNPPPFGDTYADWRNARRKDLEEGRGIYFLGSLEKK